MGASPAFTEYRTCTAQVRLRGVQPVHIVPLVTWRDDSGSVRTLRTSALCGVLAGPSAELEPSLATCQKCKRLWRRSQGRENPWAHVTEVIEANLREWEDQGALAYVTPRLGGWEVGYGGESELLAIELDVETATAFLAGMKAVGEWTLRRRT